LRNVVGAGRYVNSICQKHMIRAKNNASACKCFILIWKDSAMFSLHTLARAIIMRPTPAREGRIIPVITESILITKPAAIALIQSAVCARVDSCLWHCSLHLFENVTCRFGY
jgi:hypothetical protein